MFDLETRIHLHEVKMRILIDEEFDRTGADITYRPRCRHRDCSERFPQFCSESRCWRFFNDLLVAALEGTISLKEMHAVAVSIGKHLDFNVPRIRQVLFDKPKFISQALLHFPPPRRQSRSENPRLFPTTHPLPPPPPPHPTP